MTNAADKTSLASIKNLAQGAWHAVEGHRPQFFLFAGLFIAAYTADLVSPWAIAYTLDSFVKNGFTPEGFHGAYLGILAYLVLKLGYNLCHHLGRYIQQNVSYQARMTTLEGVFETLLSFPLSWHVHRHSGENLSKLHRATGAIDVTVGSYTWQIIEGLVKVVFASIALVALDRWVAFNVVIMGLGTVLVMVLFNRKLVSCIRANNSFSDRLNRICIDYLYNVITVKSLGLEQSSVTYLKSRREEGSILNRNILRYSELKWASVSVGYTLMIGISLFIYFLHQDATHSVFEVGAAYVLLNYLDRIFQAIGSLTAYYSGIIESATAYESATALSSEKRSFHPSESCGGLGKDWKSLELRDLHFSYAAQGGEGFKGARFLVNHGEKVALVGPSGSGKSTLLKILGGLVLPERCTVSVDGELKYSLADVASSSVIIPQEPEVFSETVRYNLSMGEKFAPQELSFFSSLCKLEEVIAKLPQGWDSEIAESGGNISVGEKQRLALARGLLRVREKSILLLDEPTSSLDPMTEKQIFYGLLHHFADRTVISACHHLSLVPLFQKIIFIRRNVVEEIGTFEELLARKGAFYQAWQDYEQKLQTEGGV